MPRGSLAAVVSPARANDLILELGRFRSRATSRVVYAAIANGANFYALICLSLVPSSLRASQACASHPHHAYPPQGWL